jgi:hypothetical protein
MAGFTILLSDERSPDFGHLGSLGLVEHRQQDHPPAWCEPVRDPRLLALQVKPKFADLASQVARTQADMQDLVENIGHCRHDLSSLAYAVVNLVRGDLVRYLAEERMSARGLQDALGFGSYETAWAWLHKLRRAMVRPERELLSGVVELDQSFLGGRSHGKPGGASEKAPITIAVERLPSGRLGRVRLDLAEMANSLDQVEFARKVIAPGTEIHTDGALVLTRLTDHGFTHHPPLAIWPVTWMRSCLDHTWFPRCSNDGPPAPCTTGSAVNTCPTTSTSSPSGSTGGLRELEGCCSTDCSSRPPVLTRTPSASSSAAPAATGTPPQATKPQLHSSRYPGRRFDSYRGRKHGSD